MVAGVLQQAHGALLPLVFKKKGGGGSSVVTGIKTTTCALLYKHAFMATWLEWWSVAAS